MSFFLSQKTTIQQWLPIWQVSELHYSPFCPNCIVMKSLTSVVNEFATLSFMLKTTLRLGNVDALQLVTCHVMTIHNLPGCKIMLCCIIFYARRFTYYLKGSHHVLFFLFPCSNDVLTIFMTLSKWFPWVFTQCVPIVILFHDYIIHSYYSRTFICSHVGGGFMEEYVKQTS